ncbi:hypothetical protein [Paracoccus laeviglucosivorans]|uniref:Uncharacterized protein n=1 Tax=Paracoccus laeviglucosivorans TaxID=1197861 RepID=A0A521E622_9RHOB|nr:hypothetical protein [Paracoccus laeviglucosivorans]SMO79347.1 hypothetical protein SAMN06265221_11174 [Paracoccus laeviglucosivorans]
MRTPSLPLDHVAIKAARDIMSNPEQAAALPESMRLLAVKIAASAFGFTIVQRHRPPNSRGKF